ARFWASGSPSSRYSLLLLPARFSAWALFSWSGSNGHGGAWRATASPLQPRDSVPGTQLNWSTATTRCPLASFSAAWRCSLFSSVTASCAGIGGCYEASDQSPVPADGGGRGFRRYRLPRGHAAHEESSTKDSTGGRAERR